MIRTVKPWLLLGSMMLSPALASAQISEAETADHSSHSAHMGHDMAPADTKAHDTPAYDMSGHNMSGHDMSADTNPPAPDPHAGHAGHGAAATNTTEEPIGNAAPPPVPKSYAADSFFGSAAMTQSRKAVFEEVGDFKTSMLFVDRAEYQVRKGRNAYRWSGEGWYGGDINRLVIKTEGEGITKESLESAEIQALYSRAIGPWFDLQAGIRHDIRPQPQRTYATVAIEGLAPYWFELTGSLFLSNKGELMGRAEASYDQRISQRLILQPRAEINFATQNSPSIAVGSGLSDMELGLRLRYEIDRRFAPYMGIEWARKFGTTARYAREDGESPQATSFYWV